MYKWMRVVTVALLVFGVIFGAQASAIAQPPAERLIASLMPLPTGDPTFDSAEADLGALSPGDIIKVIDLPPWSGMKVFIPDARAYLVKVRSVSALGDPTWATGTLIIPNTPWVGPGSRPLLVSNFAINSLGRRCTPGYRFAHNESLQDFIIVDLPPSAAVAAAIKNYAILIPDHEGPNMAYSDGPIAAHVIADVLRGVYANWPELGRFVMAGYSGGAIATGWAAKLMPSYAPDLLWRYAGSAFGGIPADFAALRPTMDGTVGVGLYGAGTIGQTRASHPELAELAAPWVQAIADLPGPIRYQEQCVETLVVAGVTLLPVAIFANVLDPYTTDIVRNVLAQTRMAGSALAGPLYLYNGSSDFWIPNSAVVALANDQRARGVDVEYADAPIEHITAAVTGWPRAAEWVVRQLGG